MSTQILAELGETLDAAAPRLATLDSYYAGTQPAAFLAPESREALGDRLRTLAVNFPRLVVGSLAERLTVTGFRRGGPASPADAELWRVWRRNGMEEASAQAHLDALVYGRSYVIVWAGRDPATPRLTVESARQVAVTRDPATREVVAALKRWTVPGPLPGHVHGGDAPRRAHAVTYTPERITRYVTESAVVDAAAVPLTGWRAVETLANPLGWVPVVPVVNRGRLLDSGGVSEMADVCSTSPTR